MKALIATGSEWNAIDCHYPRLVFHVLQVLQVLCRYVIAIDTVVTLN